MFLRHLISSLLGLPTFHRTGDPGSMVLWFSLRDKSSQKQLVPDLIRVVALDDHGCEFSVPDWSLHGSNWTSGYPVLPNQVPKGSKQLRERRKGGPPHPLRR